MFDNDISFIQEPKYPKYIVVPFDDYKQLIEKASQTDLLYTLLSKTINKENTNE